LPDTVRSISVDGHEFRLQVGDDQRTRAFVVSPAHKLSDPRFKRRMRKQMSGKGLSYDACWREFKQGGMEKVQFATFGVSVRLCNYTPKQLLDIVEEALRNALTVNPIPVIAPVMAA
jgi:hypothetical protein